MWRKISVADSLYEDSHVRRVGVLFPSFHGGGFERVALNLCEGLLDYGYLVDVLVVNNTGDLQSEVPVGATFHDFQSKRAVSCLPRLVKYINHEKPDILYTGLDYANVIAISAKLIARHPVRVVASLHKPLSLTITESPNRREKQFLRSAVRYSYRFADAIVAVSHGVADDVAETASIPRGWIDVVYNPVITSDFKIEDQSCPDHPWFSETRNLDVLIAIGRLEAQKDFRTLLNAFAIVSSIRPTARLIVLGSGSQLNMLNQLCEVLGVSHLVDFIGFQDRPSGYLLNADLFVLSSRYEGLPTVMIEALACGCPIVSTDCPSGPREILSSGEFGELVDVADPEALAYACLKSLANAGSRESRIARAGDFAIETAIANYVNLFERIDRRGSMCHERNI